jgi:apolipoprotein N-acyltransferase
VHVLHRAGKSGLGSAYVAGFSWALRHGYHVIVEMDADGSHQPEELPALLAALSAGNADLVIGSRYVRGGRVHNWPRHRELLSRGGNGYVRTVLGMPVRDATAGFRAYRADVLRHRDLDLIASQGYCFQVDLAWTAWRSGFTLAEVPITFVERARGTSKMSRAIVAEALWRTTWWAITSGRRGPAKTRPTVPVPVTVPVPATSPDAAATPRPTAAVPATAPSAVPQPTVNVDDHPIPSPTATSAATTGSAANGTRSNGMSPAAAGGPVAPAARGSATGETGATHAAAGSGQNGAGPNGSGATANGTANGGTAAAAGAGTSHSDPTGAGEPLRH